MDVVSWLWVVGLGGFIMGCGALYAWLEERSRVGKMTEGEKRLADEWLKEDTDAGTED